MQLLSVRKNSLWIIASIAFLCASTEAVAGGFTMPQVLDYPFPNRLVASPADTAFAWVLNERGVRNIWLAAAPDFKPRQLTGYSPGHGEGQELSNLGFSHDGQYLVYVYGGDPGGGWEQGAQPDPTSGTVEQRLEIHSISIKGGKDTVLADGHSPVIAPDGNRVVFTRSGQVWVATLDGSVKAQPLFFRARP